MKTVEKLKKHNQELMDQFPLPHNQEDSDFKKASKIVALNNAAIRALESGIATEPRLLKDRDMLSKDLVRIDDNYLTWKKATTAIEQGSNPRATYNKQNEVKNKKDQLKFIDYLLS